MDDLFKEDEKDHRLARLNGNVIPEDSQIIIGVVFLFLMVIGVTFNSAIIHTFRLTSSLQTPTNVLIMGIVASDTVMNLIGLPFVIASGFNGAWMFGSAWCEGYGFVTALIGISNICVLTAVALDRYLVVTQSPMAVKITNFKVMMTILTCYGYGLLWATFPLVGWGNYTVEPCLISCGPDWTNDSASSQSYTVAIFVLVLLLPICIILHCYVQIIIKVRVHQIGAVDRLSITRIKEAKLAFSVFLTILTFLAAWLPYAVMSFWTMMNGVEKLDKTVALFAPLMAKSASVWNPLIYVGGNESFRTAFINIMHTSFSRNRTNVSGATANTSSAISTTKGQSVNKTREQSL